MYLLSDGVTMNLSDDVERPGEKYNCLYDPYLKQHFRKKPIKDYLKKSGVLTEKGRVACSLKELNSYRSYIRRNLASHIQNHYRNLEEDRRRKAEKELLKRDKDRLEKFNKLKEVAKLEMKLKKESFMDRKIASQLEWLEEGQRLDSKYRKQHEARVQFLNENKRLPFMFIPADKEDIKNKIYLLSKEEEKAEKEVMREEEAQSQLEYISRDNLETDRGPIEDSSDEALEDSDKSRPESEELSESRNVERKTSISE